MLIILTNLENRTSDERQYASTLGLAAYSLVFTEGNEKQNSNCIDIVSGVVMRELKKGRGEPGDRYMKGEAGTVGV